MVIRNLKQKESESRSAASRSSHGNQVYALRQKMFGSYLPNKRIDNQSRTASIVGESTEPISSRNKVYELRKVMFGSYSK